MQLDLVRDPRKPLFFSYLLDLLLKAGQVKFQRLAAGITDQMVVVFGGANSISGLPVSQQQTVCYPLVNQFGEGSIDRGQSQFLTSRDNFLVKLLSRKKCLT